jgi:16S rRNA (guanine527-N7)-methyltransferase
MLDHSYAYLHLLKTKYEGLNLTNILDQDEFYNKQIIDSIQPYLESPIFQEWVKKTKVVVDVGFGGGFPILPLAKLLPDVKFIGVESRRKKVDAVQDIANELKLTNVKLVHSRLEDVVFDKPCTITFKAVGTLINYLPIIHAPHKNFAVFFYKGPGFKELEGKDWPSLEKDWKVIEDREVKVPGTQARLLYAVEPQNVPRGTSKSLVKISQFL